MHRFRSEITDYRKICASGYLGKTNLGKVNDQPTGPSLNNPNGYFQTYCTVKNMIQKIKKMYYLYYSNLLCNGTIIYNSPLTQTRFEKLPDSSDFLKRRRLLGMYWRFSVICSLLRSWISHLNISVLNFVLTKKSICNSQGRTTNNVSVEFIQ